MKSIRRACRLFVSLFACALGCGQNAGLEHAESIACPELGGTADLLELSYSDDPVVNGRIRAFVATSRGLADVVMEMERFAIDACDHMRRDLGAGPALPVTSVQQVCEPVRAAIARMQAAGVEIRISLVSPSCGTDSARSSRCSSYCAPSLPECAKLCSAQGALYAECTLPAVSVAISSQAAEVVRLAQTLEQHLPTLLFAEIALGRRLVEHAAALVALSASLPRDVSHAGTRGVACVTVGASLVAKAASRLNDVVGASSSATALLDPEVHPSERKNL
jgi:hypothetical protein